METNKWYSDANQAPKNTFSEIHQREANDRLQTAYTFRRLLADFFGAVKLENLQAMVAPPVNWTDNWSVAARVARSTNIGIKGPENVSLKQPTKPWKAKTLSWKEI